MPTSPTAPTAVPDFPAIGDASYNTKAYDWATHMDATYPTEMQALATNVYANAVEADADATTATTKAAEATAAASAATATANAAAWVNGGTYALNANAISGVDFQTYRKKTASSVTTTDPSADGTNWVLLGGSTIGTGGTTSTASITLTASSAAAMTITPATPGLYVTLPDATTCTKADNLYSVYNAGDYDYGVKDSAGTQLGWIRARTGAMIGLADNSTAAGVWAYYGLEKTGITASYVNSTLTNMGSTIRRIALDSNRTCFLFGGTDLYGIVYDASTQTWGSATLVRSGISSSGRFQGVLSATNQVLVVSVDSTTGMQTVTLSISTNAITVNTPVSTTLSGNCSSVDQLLSVPAQSAFALCYGRTSTVGAIRAITVSGTTPSISAEATLATGLLNTYAAFVSGSVVRTVCSDGSTIYCKPFTFSGVSTPSGGTQATATATATPFRAFINGNGNIVCHYINTTHYATIFKLTGTVEAASSVSLGTAPASIPTNADYVAVSASKTAFFAYSATTQMHCNILTDTAGTASAGTQVTITSLYQATASNPTGLFASSGNNARFMYSIATGSYNGRVQVTFDCSGTSPTLTSTVGFGGASTSNGGTTASATYASDKFGVRSSDQLYSGTSTSFVDGNNYGFNLLVTVGAVSRTKGGILSFAGVGNSNGVSGASPNESWSTYPFDSGNVGFTIQRIEAAA